MAQYAAFFNKETGKISISERPPIGKPGSGRIYDSMYYDTPEEAKQACIEWAMFYVKDRDKWYGKETYWHRIVKANT